MDEEVNEVVEVTNYKDVLVQVLLAEANAYFETDNPDVETQKIKNICALAAPINEATKIENDRYKTEAEVELKNQMNERDNQVKKETIAQELKQRKAELIANKIESGAVLTSNIAKNVATAAWIGGMAEAEFNGYTERSGTVRNLIAMNKDTIKINKPY